MTYLIRSLVLLLSLGLVSTFAVASESSMKIGVVDWQQLFTKAPQAEEAAKRLEKEFKAPKELLMEKQKEFQGKRDKWGRDKEVMSTAEKAKQEKALAKLELDLRQLDEKLRSDYTSRHREEMDAFIQVVRGVVDKLAEEEKYDLVLQQDAALYNAESIDITAKILSKLEKLKKKS